MNATQISRQNAAPTRGPESNGVGPSDRISTLLGSRWTRVILLSLLAALTVSAERISWGSLPGQDHVNSTGQPLTADFQFELGGFTGGFIPTAQNTARWSAHWIPVQRTRFNPRTRSFASQVTVAETGSPLQAGDPVYVWGFSGSESAGEWILFRSERWLWPKAHPANRIPVQWSPKDATQVALGSIRFSDGRLRLATASVTGSLPPVTTWAQWRSEQLSGEGNLVRTESIGLNHEPSIVDFVLGREPSESQATPNTRWLEHSLQTRSGAEFLEIRVPRRRDRPVHWRIEVSDDCRVWRPASVGCEVVEDGPEFFVVRQTTSTSSTACPRFVRVVPEVAP